MAVRLCSLIVRMYGTTLSWPWANRKCVCLFVCRNLKLFVFVFDTVLWGRDFTLMCCPNACTTISMTAAVHSCSLNVLLCMARCRVDPGRAVGAFLLARVWIWRCGWYWCPTQYEVVNNLSLMCCSNALQYRWRLCGYVRWMYGTVSWMSRRCIYIGVFEFEAVICVRCSTRS